MTVKEVQITGEAAQTYAPSARGGTRKKRGGGSTSPGTITQLRADHVPGIAVVPLVGVDAPLTQTGAPLTGGAVKPAPPVKVVLDAPKKKPVILQPKVAAVQKKTRRVSRSIRVSVSGLGKRLTRAKTIRKDAGTLGIAEIKKALQKATLIKADTKAPEAILRQMYADYMVLKDRAL